MSVKFTEFDNYTIVIYNISLLKKNTPSDVEVIHFLQMVQKKNKIYILWMCTYGDILTHTNMDKEKKQMG